MVLKRKRVFFNSAKALIKNIYVFIFYFNGGKKVRFKNLRYWETLGFLSVLLLNK